MSSAVHTGSAALELGFTDFEEVERLGPITVERGYVFEMAFTVVGGTVEPIVAQS